MTGFGCHMLKYMCYVCVFTVHSTDDDVLVDLVPVSMTLTTPRAHQQTPRVARNKRVSICTSSCCTVNVI